MLLSPGEEDDLTSRSVPVVFWATAMAARPKPSMIAAKNRRPYVARDCIALPPFAPAADLPPMDILISPECGDGKTIDRVRPAGVLIRKSAKSSSILAGALTAAYPTNLGLRNS